MKREIEKDLQHWAKSPLRIPLLLRGARQVGKTFIIKQFAQTHFKNTVEINFELEPAYQDCFQSLQPQQILSLISDMTRQPIVPGQTLLFLDEIQRNPHAIMALRYFKELMPELHVIGAGSLLEFAIQASYFSMPVGRVQYMYMKPMSFREYLTALGYTGLVKQLQSITLDEALDITLHRKLLQLTREYALIGGMPDVVQAYLHTQNYMDAQYKQTILLNTYRDDFGKYAKQSLHRHLQKVFEKTPALLGQQIKYNKIEDTMRSRELKEAITSLNQAGVIRSIYASNASGLPLQALINEKKFKLLFLDIGLTARATSVAIKDILHDEIHLIHQGALAEQWVGQELLAYQNSQLEPQLYYWARDELGSSAEVDYVITHDSMIIPLEVKSGATGRLKSLHLFMREKKAPLGIRISELPLSLNQQILSVPFYLVSELPRLIDLYS